MTSPFLHTIQSDAELRTLIPLMRSPVDRAELALDPAAPNTLADELAMPDYPGLSGASATLRSHDDTSVFPVVDGVPLTMRVLNLTKSKAEVDTLREHPHFREALHDLAYYDSVARELGVSMPDRNLSFLQAVQNSRATIRPGSLDHLVDAPYDGSAQTTCLSFVSESLDGPLLQLGGSGTHVLKLAVEHGRECVLLTPVLGEALYAKRLAAELGVGQLLRVAVGVAEELPFANESFAAVLSHGCIHHTITTSSFPEVGRALMPGGRFAAIEPLRTPIYRIGTKIFGKRDPHVGCSPMDSRRIEPMMSALDNARVERYGSLFRYPLLAAAKLKYEPSASRHRQFRRLEDGLSSRFPAVRVFAGSGALLAEKAA